MLRPETLTVALTASVAELKVPSVAVIAVPVPLAPEASTKYSAAAMLELPVAASLTDAFNVTEAAPTVGLGVAVILLATGPVVSRTGAADTANVPDAVAPQFPAASRPRTYSV